MNVQQEIIPEIEKKFTFDVLLNTIGNVFTQTLFKVGNTPVSLIKIIFILFSFWFSIFISKYLAKFIDKKILSYGIKDAGVRSTFRIILKYSFIAIGFLFILSFAGFEIGTLGTALAALGVGIGFGLQNVTNNFISGIIILFERPIKVGDRIEVGGINGDVYSISMRSTKIVTNDNINVIVPNSEFINNRVINWSYNERRVRFRFPVSVSYKEDPERVRKIVLTIAKENKGILKFPAPELWFTEYGDSSLNFELVVWTSAYIQKPKVLQSQIYYEIFKVFKENNIEIPYPQRDIHIVEGLEGILSKQ